MSDRVENIVKFLGTQDYWWDAYHDREVPADKTRAAAEGILAALDDPLTLALAEAENANQHGRPCQVCAALETMSESARAGVVRALAGTIGERKLSEILTANGYPTGRRAVANHRSEGHSA